MKKLLLSFSIGAISMFGYAQMSGNYTINAAQATGGTNYQTFDAAFDALTSSGVNGPVTINVIEGTYNEYLYRSYEEISGTSSTNTVTIQSDANNANPPLLTWASSYTINFNYCTFSHLTIKGLNITNTYLFAQTIRIYYGTMDSVSFEDNLIERPYYASTSNTYTPVYVQRTTCYDLAFRNNTLKNGSAGMNISYIYGNYNDNFIADGNTIENAYYYGIYNYYMYGAQCHFTNNDIEVNSAYNYTYGLYSYYSAPGSRYNGNHIHTQSSYSASSYQYYYGTYIYYGGYDVQGQQANGGIEVIGNKIEVAAAIGNAGYTYGLYSYYMGYQNTSSNPSVIANNMVTTGGGAYYNYASYIYYPSNTEIANNSFHAAGNSLYGGYAGYIYNTSTAYGNNTISNNQFVREYAGSGYTAYIYHYANFAGGGNNLYYDASNGGMYVYWYTTGAGVHSNLATLQTGSGTFGNFNENPMWVSSTDHHYNLSNLSLIEQFDGAGAPISFAYDYDNEVRIPAIPDIGPDEFGAPNNASPGQAVTPPSPFCGADSCLTITVVNTGTMPLTSVNVHWEVNGVAQTTVNWTGNMGQGQSDTIDLTCTINWQNGDEIRFWTALPNGVLDLLAGNDTMSMELYYGMSGTYSIPGNYASIADAVEAVDERGVCSATIFDIAPGTYVGDSIDLRNILGTSSLNTITWKSATGNADDVIIQYTGDNAKNFVVNLHNTDWQIFEDLTIENLSTGYGHVVNIEGNSSHNSFDRCKLKTPIVSTTSNNMAVIYAYQNGNTDFTFTGNEISGGAMGFYRYGNAIGNAENWLIQDNSITDFYYYGIYDRYMEGSHIEGNTISSSGTYVNAYGLYQWYCNGSKIERNTIGNSSEGDNGFSYGIYYYYSDGTGGDRNRIANNCITIGNDGQTGYGYYGIYMYGSDYVDVHGNTSTRIGGATTSTAYSAYYQSQSYATSIVNNSFVDYVNNNAIALYTGFGIYEFENNNIYALDSTNLILWEGAAVASLEDFQAVAGFGESSISVDPTFGDTLACVTCLPTLNNLGTPLVSSNVDLNNAARSTTTPDIGAVEYFPLEGFDLGGDSVLCASSHVINLSPTSNTIWSVNGQVVTSPNAVLTTNGVTEEFQIFLNINSEACGLITDNVTYTLVPNATLDSAMHLCADESVILNPGGSVTDTYSWSSGETTQSIQISDGGVYSVNKESLGCSSTATILVTQSIGVNVEDAEDCSSNGSVVLDATIYNGTSYAWSAGNSLNTAQNTFNDAGAYSVSATDIYGCTSSDSFMVHFLEEPVAIIDEEHSAFIFMFDGTSSNYVTSNSTYSWDFGNGQTSMNATETVTYPWSNPSSPITYVVSLTVNNGCGEHTTQMEITPSLTGVEGITVGSLKVYPNPARDVVNFDLGSAAISNGSIELMDITGRVVSDQIISTGQTKGLINVSSIDAGTYSVRVTLEGEVFTTTVVKQ
ncbi:MAG: hypothetical protein Salg2KO_15000 [Salibacteraceae bacterium]